MLNSPRDPYSHEFHNACKTSTCYTLPTSHARAGGTDTIAHMVGNLGLTDYKESIPTALVADPQVALL
jgi:hypothetical protein